MGYIKSTKPKPNMNGEYMIDITPCRDGKITIYDISHYFEPFNGWGRDNKLQKVTHEIHGKTATFYIIDSYNLLDRKQAIKLAEGFLNADFDTYRLD